MPLPNLRICIDGRMLGAQATGVASYARALHGAVRTLAADRLVLVDAPAGAAARGSALARAARLLAALPLGSRTATLVPPLRAGGDGCIVASDIFRRAQVHFDLYGRMLQVRVPGPPGIMHFTYPVPVRVEGWMNIYTVHDVIPLTHPQLTPIDGRRHRRLLDRIAAGAARLVTVSETARLAIRRSLDCPQAFVTDCGQAVDIPLGPRAPLPHGLLSGRYLLICGTVERRKNIARILAAYRAAGIAMPLVIAGPDGWKADEFASAVASTAGVIRVPFLPRAAMLALIEGARALLMPSLAEGFGLPVAEAMTLGTPVLTSGGGALEETAGGAALLVDPTDVDALAAAIAAIAADDALCTRLAERGRRRAACFTPAHFAARLSAMYGDLIADRR